MGAIDPPVFGLLLRTIRQAHRDIFLFCHGVVDRPHVQGLPKSTRAASM